MTDGVALPLGQSVLSAPLRALRKRFARASPASPLNLALQGGGAHGAFTWGALDALLEHPAITFEGLSGSSAGAMNAVVLAHGWMLGGREGARQGLADFWTELGQLMPWGSLTQGEGESIGLTPASKVLATWAGQFSPAQLNPFDLNPLRELLSRQLDFERLRSHSPFKLFVGTTNVNTGRLRVFRETELTVNVLLASACLPKIHHSIEIDGTPYWDGAYSANPAVFPLFYDCDARDVLLILLSPSRRDGTPRSLQEIDARIAELTFNAHFMREMRTFAQASEFSGASFISWGRLERRLRRMRFHMIDAGQLASLQRAETKLIAHGPFLALLRDQGRACASDWLTTHQGHFTRHSTLDLRHYLT